VEVTIPADTGGEPLSRAATANAAADPDGARSADARADPRDNRRGAGATDESTITKKKRRRDFTFPVRGEILHG
jgi:hypothetical protein